LLYSHARGASLLARAGKPPDLGALRTKHPLERTLLLTAMRTPEAVQAALRSVRPNLLCDHLFELANQFNHFYHDFPVLTGGEDREARLALVELSRRALRFGLERLGLTVLGRM
ncbi:MAG TPA: DALR anticodon-binding domain-containing protein, partial [Myxococcota bacterium]|nr:DALR anticodon-binding domain-containing protein [Myxococcota bacterium]